MEMPDSTLIAGINDNNYESFNRLFVRYYNRLCSFVVLIVHNESASEDIVQELFIRLWVKRKSIEINGSVIAYLYSSAKNSALNYLRTEYNRKHNLDKMPFSEWQNDEDLIEHVEFNSFLSQCIDKLPERSKEVFLLSRFDGLRQKEISIRLGISVKTIKNQIWKSLLYLKSCLEIKDAFPKPPNRDQA